LRRWPRDALSQSCYRSSTTVARFCRQLIENTLPDSSPSSAVEPIVRACVRAVGFGQIAPRNPGPQHVRYCIYDPPVVRARALPTLRHQRPCRRLAVVDAALFEPGPRRQVTAAAALHQEDDRHPPPQVAHRFASEVSSISRFACGPTRVARAHGSFKHAMIGLVALSHDAVPPSTCVMTDRIRQGTSGTASLAPVRSPARVGGTSRARPRP
jgi:hypothetical protein